MSDALGRQPNSTLSRIWPALLIGGLLAFHAFYNWLWLRQNVVLTGWDKARHLAQSLAYNNLLSPMTLRTLFNAVISDQVRPPLAPMAAVPLLRLFGVSGDVATMVNVFWLAVILVATWKLGVLLGGRKLGALSVVLVALLPMVYAMSRYFLLEYPLTALVALTVYLLLAGDGFQKRGTTLFLGLCLGLGLLTKRTYAAFVFAPVGLVLLRSEVLSGLYHRLRGGLRVDLKHAALALGGGLGLAALWVLPNLDTVRQLPLGGWLFPIWAGLAAVTIYLILRPPAPETNFLAALALAATLASLWYLVNVGFVQRMLLFGYGVNDPRGRSIELRSLGTYTDYLVTLIEQHLSLLISTILVAATLLLAVVLLRKRRFTVKLRRVGTGWWALVLWILGPYLVLTLSIYHEARAIMPVLPAVALLGSGVLLKLPWKKALMLLVVLLIAIGVVQFYAVSFEPLYGLVEATVLRLPLLGQTSLFGWGGYLQRPDSEATDHRYWIEPDVLQRMEEQRLAKGWDAASLGLLVNAKQINFEHFAFLVLEGDYHPRLAVERLARAHGGEPVYPRLFQHDYLLVKRNNPAADADSQAVIELILDDPPELFQHAFELDKSYDLPDGDTVYLFRRRDRPPEGVAADLFPELAQALSGMSREGDAVLVVPPTLVPLLGQHFEGDLVVFALPGREPAQDLLTEITANHDRVFAIYGEWGVEELDRAGRRWLDEHGYRAWEAWYGPTQLVVYGLPAQAKPSTIIPVSADLGQSVTLLDYSLGEGQAQPGEVLTLTLSWQARRPIGQNYKVFVHLVDDKGQLLAQRDSEPASGLKPTAIWAEGETVVDRVGLLLPATLPAGDYELLVGMYDPATLERLPLLDVDGQVIGDSVSLGTVQVP